MKLSIALLASFAAIATALPQQGGGEGGATGGGNPPAVPGVQADGQSAEQPSSSGGQGDLRPGYTSLLDALGIDKLLLNPVADAIGSLVPTPSPSSSPSPSASPSSLAAASPS